MSYMQQQQQQAGRPQSYADYNNAAPIGQQPVPDRSHGRSKSLLSGLRGNNGTSNPQQQHQQQQPQAHTFNGRPSVSSLGSVPEDGLIGNTQRPPPSTQQSSFASTATSHTTTTNTGTSQITRQTSLRQPAPMQPGQLHPEIRSVVGLVNAHAHKVYFSGPLIERKERLPDGSRNFKDESWSDVWAQLGGTTLSVWNMRAIEDAAKNGKEVPPTYINIQDAFVQVVGSVTVPAQDGQPPKRFTDVLTLNTAGSNLFLFSCQDSQSLVSWASALRLAAWEKARLEEIYTAHLLRMSLSENGQWKDPKSTLVKGKLEGWAKVRISGQTEWKRVWMVVTAGYMPAGDGRPTSPTQQPSKKNRVSALFTRSSSPPPGGSPLDNLRPTIGFYAGNKGKDRKIPIMSMASVSQAFAVYPERPEMIPHSTLMKIEGVLGNEELAMGMKGREGWILIMPEAESEKVSALEMLKWIVGIHDAFQLYGRPQGYTWDPREPNSMMFAYPVGPLRDHLFLDRELAEGLDPRDDRTSFIRSQLLGVQVRRMRGLPVQIGQHPSQVLPSPGTSVINGPGTATPPAGTGGAPMLPPLDGLSGDQFGSSGPLQQQQSQQYAAPPQQTPPSQQYSPPQQPPYSPQAQQQSPQQQYRPGNSSPQLPPLGFGGSSPGPDRAKPVPAAPVSPTQEASPLQQLALPHPAPTTTSAMFNQPVRPPQQLATPVTVTSPTSLRPPTPGGTAAPPRPASPGTTSARAFQSVPRSPTPTGTRQQQSFTGQPMVSSPASSMHSFQNRPSIDGLPPAHGASAIIASVSGNQIATPTVLPRPPPMGAGPEVVPPPVPGSPGLASTSTASPRPGLSPLPSQSHTPQTASMTSMSSGQPQVQRAVSPTKQPLPLSPPIPNEGGYSGGYPDDIAAARQYLNQTLQHQDSMVSARTDSFEETTAESEYSDGRGRPDPNAGGGGVGSTSGHSLAYLRSTSLTRKPSGARAQPPSARAGGNRVAAAGVEKLPPVQASPPALYDEPDQQHQELRPQAQHQQSTSTTGMGDEAADALAALSFLEREQQETTPTAAAVRPLAVVNKAASPPRAANAPLPSRSPVPTPQQYPSSFAQSKGAQEREAQRVARQEAAKKPGRPNGKGKGGAQGGRGAGWQSSDEEEEEEDEDEDDEEDDEDAQPTQLPPRLQQEASQHSQQASPVDGAFGGRDSRSRQMQDSYSQQFHAPTPPQQRASRMLPQIPGAQGRSPAGSAHGHQTPPRGFDEPSPSRQTSYNHPEDEPRQHQLRPQAQPSALPPSRQTVWSSVLDPSAPQPAVNAPHGRETFIQLEPSETMTKAFTPHGLLQAGMQDKQDRSAKKQEEFARETGGSLINVPSKPPPPQTGLLGAITAHERERNREGGVGAALTAREREKRLAEERQRKIDELSRQQLEQLGQGAAGGSGSVYNAAQPGGFPPFNPMMYMNPMMGYMPMMPGMMSPQQMPGFQPQQMSGFQQQQMSGFQQQQQMWAAQQAAAEAYQRTMIAFSSAGSQAGDAPDSGAGGAPQLPVGAEAPTPAAPMSPPPGWNPYAAAMMGGMPMFNPMMGMMPPWGGASAPPSEFGAASPPPRRNAEGSPARGGSPALNPTQ